jgi:3D (Asp-Asp-Asp) domain-containing protein
MQPQLAALRVTATAYNSEPAQTDSTPFVTASGTRVRAGTLAVSRDLLELLPYGTKIYVVEDTMHPRWKRRVDFWMPSRAAAWRFGRREMTLTLWGE